MKNQTSQPKPKKDDTNKPPLVCKPLLIIASTKIREVTHITTHLRRDLLVSIVAKAEGHASNLPRRNPAEQQSLETLATDVNLCRGYRDALQKIQRARKKLNSREKRMLDTARVRLRTLLARLALLVEESKFDFRITGFDREVREEVVEDFKTESKKIKIAEKPKPKSKSRLSVKDSNGLLLAACIATKIDTDPLHPLHPRLSNLQAEAAGMIRDHEEKKASKIMAAAASEKTPSAQVEPQGVTESPAPSPTAVIDRPRAPDQAA